jgi:hypothetical protein
MDQKIVPSFMSGTRLLLSYFSKINSNFLDRYSERHLNTKIMKIRLLRDLLFHADGQIDMKKLIVAFRCFSDDSKK